MKDPETCKKACFVDAGPSACGWMKVWSSSSNLKPSWYPCRTPHRALDPKPLYSRSPKVGNPIASILKSNVWGIPALFDLYPVSNFMGLTVNPYIDKKCVGFRVWGVGMGS